MRADQPAAGTRQGARRSLLALLLALAAALAAVPRLCLEQAAFVGAAPSVSPRALQGAHRLQLCADKEGKEVVDVDVLDEEDEEDFEDEDGEGEMADGQYPPEAYKDYAFDEDPPQSWFDRRQIDRHKVNMKFFDMFKKPRSFFPHKLQPGDTIRVFYMQPAIVGEGRVWTPRKDKLKTMKQAYFDGVLMAVVGNYHHRYLVMRAMTGKVGEEVGMEMSFPMHSPLLTKIEVLRRGYIGRNKNCFFIRGMVGKKNIIPLDKERTEMDELYASLELDKREDEIPEPEYPKTEEETYPYPEWIQDKEDWDEDRYEEGMFDKRNMYEKKVIGNWGKHMRVRPRIIQRDAGGESKNKANQKKGKR